MNVLFDARWIRTDAPSDGVSRYTSNLARELSRRSDITLTVLIHDTSQLASLPDIPHIIANNPSNLWRERSIARLLNPHNFDVVYSPFFIMGWHGRNYRLVLTIHDLIYFKHRTPPQWLAWYVRVAWWLFHLSYRPLRWLLNHADAIATVSHTARDELLAAQATKQPIYTVPNAAAQEFAAPTHSDHANANHVVYMGAFTPYKNVECLITATAKAPDITLDLCSKLPPARRRQLETYARQQGAADRVVFHNGVSDQEYRQLLDQARCLATASRLEGFGLPIIEAQQAGVPVICSDIPIFHEVGEDSVLYFDPNQPAQAAQHIQHLADTTLSQDLIARGHRNAARYTWSASAEAANGVCQTITKRKRPEPTSSL